LLERSFHRITTVNYLIDERFARIIFGWLISCHPIFSILVRLTLLFYGSFLVNYATFGETKVYNTDANALASGQRIRLKETIVDEEGDVIDENELAPITRIYLTALRDYGAYLVDNAGGFTFYAEDVHTAVLHLSDDEVNALIGESLGTLLPVGMTKWQIVIETLGEDLELIPLAVSPGDEEPRPKSAEIETANFEVVEPAFSP